MKVYNRGHNDANWINIIDIEYVNNYKDAELVILPGGSDIDPGYYNQKVGMYTHARRSLDQEDFKVSEWAVKHNIPIIGICRGAQLLCVLSGGELIQHITGHHSSHQILTQDNKLYTVNSIHHQMMYPFKMDKNNYEVLAHTYPNKSTQYLNGLNEDVSVGFKSSFNEPEVVWFNDTKGLAIQSHPEFMSMPDATQIYMNQLVKNYILNE